VNKNSKVFNIAVIAAADRYNYGDLLFPLIIKHALREFDVLAELDVAALTKSDLTRFGGVPTQSLFDIKHKESKYDLFIVGGGDVLGARWGDMKIHSSTGKACSFYKWVKKYLGAGVLDLLVRIRGLCWRRFPWVIERKKTPIAYNAVGGAWLKRISAKHKKLIAKIVTDSDFVSVRDKDVAKLIRQEISKSQHDKVKVSPDSAILLSRYFDVEYLESKISAAAQPLISKEKKHLCVQTHGYLKNEEAAIFGRALDRINREMDMRIIFIPIGRVPLHEDQNSLERIRANMKSECESLSSDTSIFDIMYFIATARAFVGTSLHGNITAMSYGVPSIGLDLGVPKVKSFIDTWASDNQSVAWVSVNSIYEVLQKTLVVSSNVRFQHTDNLIQLARNNFFNIFQKCQLLEGKQSEPQKVESWLK